MLLAGATLAVLALAGCSQSDSANDNPDPRQDSRTVVPPTILRTPVEVPDAPATVPLPGRTAAPGDNEEAAED